MSVLEKIVHWFSPPQDTCVKGPTAEEADMARQEWREQIHGSRHALQRMQADANLSKRTFSEVHKRADEGIRIAEEAIKILEATKEHNRIKDK